VAVQLQEQDKLNIEIKKQKNNWNCDVVLIVAFLGLKLASGWLVSHGIGSAESLVSAQSFSLLGMGLSAGAASARFGFWNGITKLVR